jgi:hypothetical protein
MNQHVRRIALVVIAAEVLGVAILAMLVAVLGPPGGFEAAKPFAERLGAWIGPISGFVLCMAGGWWVARSAKSSRLRYGSFTGIAAAVLDITIALAIGAQFSALLALSNLGRVAEGTIGGSLASHSTNSQTQ